jgi:cation diffusion facilitator CzcD-associated flavoprotein CzcO
MKDISCKLLVIGAGPGGYVCAIRAGQLGVDTVIVEAPEAGRHLPHHRLHPVQGADPRGGRVREGGAGDGARIRSAFRWPIRRST